MVGRKWKAVFLDRDGTINVEKDYLFRIEDFEFIPGAPKAIRRLKEAGFKVIVVTNQSGVARGYYTLDDVKILHEHIQKELAKFKTSVDGFYICPHHPTSGIGNFLRDCDCRKGKPGLLLQASVEHGIDLSRSFMIGDKIADVEAGLNAGCMPLMVLTGYGEKEAQRIQPGQVPIFRDILEAAGYVVSQVDQGNV